MKKLIIISLLIVPFCEGMDSIKRKLFSKDDKVDSSGVLDLSERGLTQFPPKKEISSSKIIGLNLSDNDITSIPLNLFLLSSRNLQVINLSNNKITEDSLFAFVDIGRSSYSGPGSLVRVLNLSQNKLGNTFNNEIKFSQEVYDATHIHSAKLSNEFPKLEELYLNNNQLTRLNPEVLTKNKRLTLVDLRGNPIEEDNLEELQKIAEEKGIRLLTGEGAKGTKRAQD